MKRVALVVLLLGPAAVSTAAAQAEGVIAGQVRQAESRAGLPAAEVLVDGRVGAVSDTGGRYRVRAVRTGWHRVSARLIGYRGSLSDVKVKSLVPDHLASVSLPEFLDRLSELDGEWAARVAGAEANGEILRYRESTLREIPGGPLKAVAGIVARKPA